mgnify:CR=1 FL=1
MSEGDVIKKMAEFIGIKRPEELAGRIRKVLEENEEVREIVAKIDVLTLQMMSFANQIIDLYANLVGKLREIGEEELVEYFERIASVIDSSLSVFYGEGKEND